MDKDAKNAHKQRAANQKQYDKFNIEPTEVNGEVVRSRLEALWIEEFNDCPTFQCFECVKVPLWITGPYGRFLANYQPDLLIVNGDGERILVELKPNYKLAMEDDRQKRALELNPHYKFVVIGGYPYTKKGVTVRMLTGKKEIVHRNVDVWNVRKLFECDCED